MGRAPARFRKRLIVEPDETAIHISIADWLRVSWPEHLPWWHCPNGGARPTITKTKTDGTTVTFSPVAKTLQRMGVLPGVWDFNFVLPNAQFGMWEVKTRTGELTPEQIDLGDLVRPLGVALAIVRSIDDAERVGSRWLAAYGLKLRASTVVRAAAPAPLLDEVRA